MTYLILSPSHTLKFCFFYDTFNIPFFNSFDTDSTFLQDGGLAKPNNGAAIFWRGVWVVKWA
jgi:hypothetical protein